MASYWAEPLDFLDSCRRATTARRRARLAPVLRVYGEVAKKALGLAVRSWLAALSIPVYAVLFLVVARLVTQLFAAAPTVAGIAIGLLGAACFGGYLSLLKQAVAGSSIRFSDLKDGLRSVWDVAGVLFIIWIIEMIVDRIAAGNPSGVAIKGVVTLAIAIFFNLIPELICHSRNRGIALLQESGEFIFEHPVAWFAPNLVFAAVILWGTGLLSFTSLGSNLAMLGALGSPSGVLLLIAGAGWTAPLLIAFVHYVMVFRGLLYLELSSGSSRMRDFRRRMG